MKAQLLLLAILVGASSARFLMFSDTTGTSSWWGTTQWWGWASTVQPMATGLPSTQAPTTTPYVYPTTTATPSSNYSGPGCGKCEYSQIWTDVIYLIDASQASGSKSLADMWGLVQSSSGWYNLQRTGYNGGANYMRAGVITYASDAHLVAPLGSMNYDDMINTNPTYFAGDEGTNIEAAIQMAVNQFAGSGHRANAKKVIVLMATTYNRGNYNAPQKAATSFIEDGGVLVVYDYVPNHGEPSTDLQELASPGYFIYSPDSTQDSLMQAQCDANCFCPPNFAAYGQSPRGTPQNGCYYAVDIRLNYQIGNNNCKNKYNNGYIASDQNAAKNSFLTQQIGQNTDFTIGLSFNSSSHSWKWADGSALSGNYHPWYNGVQPYSDANGGCVYVSHATGEWIQTDCRYGYYFACESKPCTSTNYCGVFSV